MDGIVTDRHIVVRLARIPREVDRLDVALNTEDAERAARFRFPEDRARMIAGRWLLGQCLSRFFGVAAGPIDLIYTSRGRPELARIPEIAFSISHTGDLVAVALAHGARVGIDLERTDRKIDSAGLVTHVLSAQECVKFQALSEAEKIPAFFQVWTAKEAWLKARGVGISEGLRELSVPFEFDLEVRALAGIKSETGPQAWQLQGLPVPEGYAGNVIWDDAMRCVDFGWLETEVE